MLALCSLTPAWAEDVTLVAVGDIMMARGVDWYCHKKGWDYPFARTQQRLHSADLAFANLECPVSKRGARMSRIYTFRADPACLPAIRRAGFRLLSLANNHTMDYGRVALADTLEGVERNGMRVIGAGPTYAQALLGIVVQARGLRIGFVGFSAFPSVAGVFAPQQPSLAVMSDERLKASIHDLKRRCDIVVVSCHWGIEGNRHHSAMQERLAHLAIDAGAALVLGHHPHVAQEIERYKRGLIVYSLGNFVFDDESRGGNSGLLVTCRLNRTGVVAYRSSPVAIHHCQPTIGSNTTLPLASER